MEDTTRHSVFSDGILNFVSAGRDSDRPLPKLLLGLSVIVLIASMFPHGGQREITYRVGTVWVDEDLISPFPFPIYRDAASYDEDRQKAGRDFYPVFERAEGVPAAVQQALETRLRVLPRVAEARERLFRSHVRQDSLTFLAAQPAVPFVLTAAGWNAVSRWSSGRSSSRGAAPAVILSGCLTDVLRKGILDREVTKIGRAHV